MSWKDGDGPGKGDEGRDPHRRIVSDDEVAHNFAKAFGKPCPLLNCAKCEEEFLRAMEEDEGGILIEVELEEDLN